MTDQQPQAKGASEQPVKVQEVPADLGDLHALVSQAAAEPWAREDYGQAVRSSWFALRELLRERLGEPQLDGAALVNAIGEDKPPIRLPLTDYRSSSEQNMHRGVVNFLRGVVYYVRNPDAHDPSSMDVDDRVGAFERLSIMSLCARHVEAAASPSAVEDAIAELLQPKFPNSDRAFTDLIDTIPPRLRGELARAALEEAKRAHKDGDHALINVLRRFYPEVLAQSGWSTELVAQSVRDLTPLLARDETLQLGTVLLPRLVYTRLRPRHQERVARLLIEGAKDGRTSLPRLEDLQQEISYLWTALKPTEQKEIDSSVLDGLTASDVPRQRWSLWVAYELGMRASPARRKTFASAIAEAITKPTGATIIPALQHRLEPMIAFERQIAASIRQRVRAGDRAKHVEAALRTLGRQRS